MLDSLSLDQLRTFVAAVDEGSFSAAARKMNRVQSAVSDVIAKLEANFGVPLFDRSGRYRKLTKQGEVLLSDARSVLAGVDEMRARAKGISSGIEAELSVVIDVMFPIAPITDAAKAFREKFPGTPLRIYVEVLGVPTSRFLIFVPASASLAPCRRYLHRSPWSGCQASRW